MCAKVVDNYTHALKFFLNQYKTHEMCVKAVNDYSSTMQLFLNAIRLNKCVRAVNTCFFFVFDSVPD